MFHLPLLWDVCYSLFSHLFFAENGAKQLCREDYFTNPQYTPSFSFRDFWTAALVVWFLPVEGGASQRSLGAAVPTVASLESSCRMIPVPYISP